MLTIITMSAIIKRKTLGGVAFLLGAMPTSISNVSLFYTQVYLWQWHKLALWLKQYLIWFDYDCRLLTITGLTMNQTKSATLQLEINDTLSTLHLPDFFLPSQLGLKNQTKSVIYHNIAKRKQKNESTVLAIYKLQLTACLLPVWYCCPPSINLIMQVYISK